MKILELPHCLSDYLCPVNGLCDIYQWKTGKRLPEELIFYSHTGFQLISQNKSNPPKMIFLGNTSIGERQFNFWKDIIGYNIFSNEDKTFVSTLSEIKELIDKNIPVIIFGLDMFHLEYQTKFYHKTHIPGHVVLMVGYDHKGIYIHDNSKQGIQSIFLDDLLLAWQNDYIGISKKNAYFGIDMKEPNVNVGNIIKRGLHKTANLFLNPPVSFMGSKGLERFLTEFSTWHTVYSDKILKSIYFHFITFTGSTLPEPPSEFNNNASEINNPHQAARDALADALLKYIDNFGEPSWKLYAQAFKKSGEIIEQVVHGFTQDILSNTFNNSLKYAELFRQIRDIETQAYKNFLCSSQDLNLNQRNKI
ncbi:BtrH N-terminal domain-containing protein [Tissierella praeacuta]|uniref:BtrH N-terminal domain-containing protein n=1 Tax=Tissierella praeacuta TaxID=43131 RepID=UPI003340F09C